MVSESESFIIVSDSMETGSLERKRKKSSRIFKYRSKWESIDSDGLKSIDENSQEIIERPYKRIPLGDVTNRPLASPKKTKSSRSSKNKYGGRNQKSPPKTKGILLLHICFLTLNF